VFVRLSACEDIWKRLKSFREKCSSKHYLHLSGQDTVERKFNPYKSLEDKNPGECDKLQKSKQSQNVFLSSHFSRQRRGRQLLHYFEKLSKH